VSWAAGSEAGGEGAVAAGTAGEGAVGAAAAPATVVANSRNRR